RNGVLRRGRIFGLHDLPILENLGRQGLLLQRFELLQAFFEGFVFFAHVSIHFFFRRANPSLYLRCAELFDEPTMAAICSNVRFPQILATITVRQSRGSNCSSATSSSSPSAGLNHGFFSASEMISRLLRRFCTRRWWFEAFRTAAKSQATGSCGGSASRISRTNASCTTSSAESCF